MSGPRAAAARAARAPLIGRAAELVAGKLAAGGRLVYVGGGTSGRLGTLDAVECVPTFGIPPSRVVPIIAGGPSALTRSVEGAEDSARDAEQRLRRVAVGPTDAVCCIAASGVTPFVLAALEYARFRRAATIFVTCGRVPERAEPLADVVIALDTGPEVIAGSTRLKAGTATKIVLNMLTTAAMIRIGKTYGNLMVDVQMGSEKLKDRARRIISIVTGLDYDAADALLRKAHWNVKAAIVMQKGGLTYTKSLSRLRHAHDVVRDAIGEDVEARLRELLKVG